VHEACRLVFFIRMVLVEIRMEEDSVQDCNQPSQIGEVLPQGNVVEINEACVPVDLDRC